MPGLLCNLLETSVLFPSQHSVLQLTERENRLRSLGLGVVVGEGVCGGGGGEINK